MIFKRAPTLRVEIYISGDIAQAKQACREFCQIFGDCVTVEPISYVYKGGEEAGVRVAWINYPRFPRTEKQIIERAGELAALLMERLSQQSLSIVAPSETYWFSKRPEDQEPA